MKRMLDVSCNASEAGAGGKIAEVEVIEIGQERQRQMVFAEPELDILGDAHQPDALVQVEIVPGDAMRRQVIHVQQGVDEVRGVLLCAAVAGFPAFERDRWAQLCERAGLGANDAA